jgi:hypothetical protein
MPTCYVTPGKRKGLKVMRAFAQGCAGPVSLEPRLRPGPAAFYGITAHLKLLIDAAAAGGRDWYYVDNGYFRRGTFWRVTRQALQHGGVGTPDFQRLARLGVRIAPWRRGGRHLLVCPPGEAFCRLSGFDHRRWLAEVLDRLARHTDREIRIRVKPTARTPALQPLAADLADCHALVTHMSNAAVEALVAGVPVFATGPCAAAAMGLADLARIERPIHPEDRRQWAAVLAANQWTLQEMRDGTCWRAVSEQSAVGRQSSVVSRQVADH